MNDILGLVSIFNALKFSRPPLKREDPSMRLVLFLLSSNPNVLCSNRADNCDGAVYHIFLYVALQSVLI